MNELFQSISAFGESEATLIIKGHSVGASRVQFTIAE